MKIYFVFLNNINYVIAYSITNNQILRLHRFRPLRGQEAVLVMVGLQNKEYGWSKMGDLMRFQVRECQLPPTTKIVPK